jgi:hypothetical protein
MPQIRSKVMMESTDLNDKPVQVLESFVTSKREYCWRSNCKMAEKMYFKTDTWKLVYMKTAMIIVLE